MATTKFKCDCGLSIYEHNMNKHINSRSHITKIEQKNRKINNYNNLKDLCNCCSICNAIDIPEYYFITDKAICLCCYNISKGGEKECKICKQLVNINKMERPYLKKCKECAAKRIANFRRESKISDQYQILC